MAGERWEEVVVWWEFNGDNFPGGERLSRGVRVKSVYSQLAVVQNQIRT